MKKVLVLGAGRSASTLIQYLLTTAEKEDWFITVADVDRELAAKKIGKNLRGKAVGFDVNNVDLREQLVKESDIVISLLPVQLHAIVARDCVHFKTHMVTASYISTEMAALDSMAKREGLIMLNELGVDPGIDHMSAMKKIDEIKEKGGKLLSFKSYCGALISPEFNNVWGYKFTWAPKNVILAGQGTAKYIKEGHVHFIPYNRLFLQTETVEIPGYGKFEAYSNRDSLNYIVPYGLQEVPNLLRGTLRVPGYCKAWNAFIKIGLTDDTYRIRHSETMTWNEFIFSFVERITGKSDEESLAIFLGEANTGDVMKKLIWTGILSNEKTVVENGTPAEILLHLLEQKWKFEEGDSDIIVMQHQFIYELEGKKRKCLSSLVVKGTDHLNTAISATVGLPAAMGAKLILQGKIKERGVLMPVTADFYEPILDELEGYGVKFIEEDELM